MVVLNLRVVRIDSSLLRLYEPWYWTCVTSLCQLAPKSCSLVANWRFWIQVTFSSRCDQFRTLRPSTPKVLASGFVRCPLLARLEECRQSGSWGSPGVTVFVWQIAFFNSTKNQETEENTEVISGVTLLCMRHIIVNAIQSRLRCVHTLWGAHTSLRMCTDEIYPAMRTLDTTTPPHPTPPHIRSEWGRIRMDRHKLADIRA